MCYSTKLYLEVGYCVKFDFKKENSSSLISKADEKILPANARRTIRVDIKQGGSPISSTDASEVKDEMSLPDNARKVINTVYNYKKTDESNT